MPLYWIVLPPTVLANLETLQEIYHVTSNSNWNTQHSEVSTTQKKVPSVFVIKMEKVNGDNYIHLGELACISYLI